MAVFMVVSSTLQWARLCVLELVRPSCVQKHPKIQKLINFMSNESLELRKLRVANFETKLPRPLDALVWWSFYFGRFYIKCRMCEGGFRAPATET